ncbi:hypothetical protein BJ165DRAFT_1523453 [Panaeolus papilionaceus]|nr:hypothetical protein BJ165DRAFT_1523453 [Panaeolus papilionaceus]
MNNWPVGQRVFYWTTTGGVEYANVVGSNILPDGTRILALRVESTGETVMMPAAAANRVVGEGEGH